MDGRNPPNSTAIYGRNLAVLRGMTPEERVRKAFALSGAVRDLFRAAEHEVVRTVAASELERFLKERFGPARIAAACVVAGGIVMLRWA